MKAKINFSYGGKIYNEGDNVDVLSNDDLEYLKERKLVIEGKGEKAEATTEKEKKEHITISTEKVEKKKP